VFIMHDRHRVVFHSSQDMASGYLLSQGEDILKAEFFEAPSDINDVLELYNIKLYIDNGVFLKNWSQEEIETFKKRVQVYGGFFGEFISNIDDSNVLTFHNSLIFEYYESFWMLINNLKRFKSISSDKIEQILTQEPHQIRTILKYKKIVEKYHSVLRDFLLKYQQSAEILLSIYEVRKDFNHVDLFLPNSLTIQDKEKIICDYIDSEDCNTNYLPIILNSKKSNLFNLSDKTRLKAKRKHQEETSKFFDEKSNSFSMKYGVAISYPENASKIKEAKLEDTVTHYTYSLDFIKSNNHSYLLYQNFKLLFDYLDHQNRINLISKTNQLGLFEKMMGVRSRNEYCCGISFQVSEMASQAQIFTYSNILNTLDNSLEEILQFVFNTVFSEKYGFANNATLTMPTSSALALEKVRTLAPELESVLKQYKLFVQDNQIDFELLQISSSPSSMKDIPSLNEKKYIYLNTDNQEANSVANLFFSDQRSLAYVEPFKEKKYQTFYELLINENYVYFSNYENHQKDDLKYLIENNYIFIDQNDRIQVNNVQRVLILWDIFKNEYASFYHYPENTQREAEKMSEEGLTLFGSSLLSKPEQDYFNYYLNKGEFTNGLDLRNSYLHGTQANPSQTDLHENSYLIYLKLLTLILLKIEDDLLINKSK
jgi:hypothetical protein